MIKKFIRNIILTLLVLLGIFYFMMFWFVGIPALFSDSEKPKSEEVKQPQVVKIVESSPSSFPKDPNEFKVTKVIDGDTVEIEGGQRVRYIGIDTPETVDPSRPVGCFGKAASDKNKELVEGKVVRLEKDVSETDKYGRLLRYVYINNTFVNDYLVRQGFANSVSYPPDIKFQDQFRLAEAEAREANRGLWGSCNSTVPPQQTVTPPPAPAPPAATPESPPTTSCKYSCSSPDRDCADFSSHNEAQTFFNCCGFTATNDPMKLDGTGVDDGVACESI